MLFPEEVEAAEGVDSDEDGMDEATESLLDKALAGLKKP